MVTPGKPIAPKDSSIVHDNLGKERANAEAAAKESAKHAIKSKKKKKEEGKKKDGIYRMLPAHSDMVDLVDDVPKYLDLH